MRHGLPEKQKGSQHHPRWTGGKRFQAHRGQASRVAAEESHGHSSALAEQISGDRISMEGYSADFAVTPSDRIFNRLHGWQYRHFCLLVLSSRVRRQCRVYASFFSVAYQVVDVMWRILGENAATHIFPLSFKRTQLMIIEAPEYLQFYSTVLEFSRCFWGLKTIF